MKLEVGSLIGFALVFVAATWLASAALCAWLTRARDRLRRAGPRAERRAAALALILPVAIGAALSIGLMVYAALGPSLGVVDHCLEHEHHLHLCLWHGGAWGARAWAVVSSAGIGGVLAARLLRSLHRRWSIVGQLRAVRSGSVEHRLNDGTRCVRVPSRALFCFSAGWLAPKVYLSDAVLTSLDERQLRAVLAHERAHLAHGDLWRGSALAVLALLGAPVAAAAALRVWHEASERLSDRVAAEVVGSPAAVASSILAFARGGAATPGCAFVPHRDLVSDRVEAVLARAPVSERAPRALAIGAVAGFGLFAASATAVADSVHHAIETLIGRL